MCGLAGFLLNQGGNAEEMAARVIRMADAVQHRGPDSRGHWIDAAAGIALGHRRLSIVDLSAAGAQPMVSECGRFVIALNGEIYNHRELRDRLDGEGKGLAWRGHSDTETLLAGIRAWGLERTLQRAVGMFALALWDRQARRLFLARDRFGEKPLYYGMTEFAGERAFIFGSELKALCAFPGFSGRISSEALRKYLQFLYVPAPWTIYEDARKLEAGHILELDPAASRLHAWPLSKPYWDIESAIRDAAGHRLKEGRAALDAVEASLRDAVRLQMLSDVPLGAFLSGGVDSSLIVALMQQEAAAPIRTFTVGFEETSFDESSQALAVARHLRTDHTEIFVTSAEARAVIPTLPRMYDEPFADSSQVPTHLVCRAARQFVTVALSGDGGDELFGGYNRYFWGPALWRRLSLLPFPLRRGLGHAIRTLPSDRWDQVGKLLNHVRGGTSGVGQLGNKVHKLGAALLSSRVRGDVYTRLVSTWDPDQIVQATHGTSITRAGHSLDESDDAVDFAEYMMYRDVRTYMPDDVLCKVDRAAMACGLETRAPFLDHRVAQTAWRLPLRMKLRGTSGKWALREILAKYVPAALTERPKTGFSIPVGTWLRGPLRDWAEALLDRQALVEGGHLRSEPVRKLWAEHLAGRTDRSPELWSVLMFQAWLAERR